MVVNFQEFIKEESSRASLYHAIKFDRAKLALDRNIVSSFKKDGYQTMLNL